MRVGELALRAVFFGRHFWTWTRNLARNLPHFSLNFLSHIPTNMKLFLLALVSSFGISISAETPTSLRRAAIVESDGTAVNDAFAKLYIDQLAANPFHQNEEAKAYYSTYNIPGEWRGCGEIMGGGVSNTLDQEDLICCANTAGCGTQTSMSWQRGCEVW